MRVTVSASPCPVTNTIGTSQTSLSHRAISMPSPPDRHRREPLRRQEQWSHERNCDLFLAASGEALRLEQQNKPPAGRCDFTKARRGNRQASRGVRLALLPPIQPRPYPSQLGKTYLKRMCGRYDNLIPRGAYSTPFRAARVPRSNFPPRYNVAPTDQIPIVRIDPRDGEREITMARWGLIPF
jgi:SOS response associated peptidase (SRAP)